MQPRLPAGLKATVVAMGRKKVGATGYKKTCVCLFCLEFANANVAPATFGALGPVLAAVDLEPDRTLRPELLEYPILVVGG